ncbi:hypothetical protein PpBr36_07809 [Pyricularia pennisetigena]|uniref:hypothetical protein n=1 Tax=Pyricularia pennisetigena TaxID=1578925 RepID=UPI0011534567|nr:hypothetical protein PpBr36_07809 [Pyricularia pennisetigena]TLS26038.1 hypothetical protein PpBr36_07809 [Pyricularia pennisetigena]
MPGFRKWSDVAAMENGLNYQPPPPALSSPSPKILPTLEADRDDLINILPQGSVQGLTAVAVISLISFLACLGLSIYLTWKLISWNLRPFPPSPPNQQQCSSVPERRSQTTLDYGGMNIPAEHLCPQMETNDDAPGDAGEKSFKGLRLFVERLRREPPNQFLILIYNLLLADVQQSLAFLFSFHWAARGSLDGRSRMCWAQGWFLSIGDLGSSLMITAIAVHTYLGVIKNYRPSTCVFYVVLASLWLIDYLFAVTGVFMTWRTESPLFAPVGVWCGINPERQDIRLYLHYLWTSLSIVVITVVYIYIYIYLQRKKVHSGKVQHYPYGPYHKMQPRPKTPSPAAKHDLKASPGGLSTPPVAHSAPKNSADEDGTTSTKAKTKNGLGTPAGSTKRHPAFLLYPLIYILCTAPLSLCRVAGRATADAPSGYLCFAGVMLGGAGLLDALLYATTRRSIIFAGEKPPTQDTGIDTFAFVRTPPGRKFGNVVFVRGGEADEEMGVGAGRDGGSSSTSSNNSSNNSSNSSSKSGGGGGAGDDSLQDRRRVEVGEAKQKFSAAAVGGFLQMMRPGWREQRRNKKDNHHLRVSGMDTTGLRIQCETVMSVSVEMDPDRMNRSQASLTSEFSAVETACGPARASKP